MSLSESVDQLVEAFRAELSAIEAPKRLAEIGVKVDVNIDVSFTVAYAEVAPAVEVDEPEDVETPEPEPVPPVEANEQPEPEADVAPEQEAEPEVSPDGGGDAASEPKQRRRNLRGDRRYDFEEHYLGPEGRIDTNIDPTSVPLDDPLDGVVQPVMSRIGDHDGYEPDSIPPAPEAAPSDITEALLAEDPAEDEEADEGEEEDDDGFEDEPEVLIHSMERTERAKSGRIGYARCGATEKLSTNESFQTLTGWYSHVTCTECRSKARNSTSHDL